MDLSRLTRRLTRIDRTTWQIEPTGAMRVPAVIYAGEGLIREMDEKVYEQTANVAYLPVIVKAAYVMPDAHWGSGFPIGGVADSDAQQSDQRDQNVSKQDRNSHGTLHHVTVENASRQRRIL
jgi:tRNA-splicing ligase RtcB